MLDHDYKNHENLLFRIKKCINATDMFDSDYVMTCNAAVPSDENI